MQGEHSAEVHFFAHVNKHQSLFLRVSICVVFQIAWVEVRFGFVNPTGKDYGVA